MVGNRLRPPETARAGRAGSIRGRPVADCWRAIDMDTTLPHHDDRDALRDSARNLDDRGIFILDLIAENEQLRARVVDLASERNTYREIAILGIHALYRLTRDRDRLRAELRELRREHREAA